MQTSHICATVPLCKESLLLFSNPQKHLSPGKKVKTHWGRCRPFLLVPILPSPLCKQCRRKKICISQQLRKLLPRVSCWLLKWCISPVPAEAGGQVLTGKHSSSRLWFIPLTAQPSGIVLGKPIFKLNTTTNNLFISLYLTCSEAEHPVFSFIHGFHLCLP